MRFLQGAVRSLAPDAEADMPDDSLNLPDEFPSPPRKRMRENSPEEQKDVTGSEGKGGRHVAACGLISALASNLHDSCNENSLDLNPYP